MFPQSLQLLCHVKRKKFRRRNIEDIKREITVAARVMPYIKRVFLADGNALTLPTGTLLSILQCLDRNFPLLERVATYCNPQDLLQKEVEELVELRRFKLGMVYLGVESGSASVLEAVRKGATPADIVDGARKARAAGIPLSVTVINGLAGREGTEHHARETARLLNEIDPDYLGLLSLIVVPGTITHRQVRDGTLTPLSLWEILQEIKMMVEPLSLTNCVFRANHASNYLPLKALLSRDKKILLSTLDRVLQNRPSGLLRSEDRRLL